MPFLCVSRSPSVYIFVFVERECLAKSEAFSFAFSPILYYPISFPIDISEKTPYNITMMMNNLHLGVFFLGVPCSVWTVM